MNPRVLSVVALLGVLPVSASADGPLPDAAHVYVEGSASIEVVPDSLKLTVRFEAIAPYADAAKAQIDERTRSLIVAFQKLKVPERDYNATAPYASPATEYDNGRSRVIGTQVSRTVTVTLRKLADYGEFIAAVMASNPTSIGDVEVRTEKEKEVLARAQVEALADARARAAKLAAAANMTLGSVYSVSEFESRREESYLLHPNRGISDRQPVMLGATGASRGRDEPFVPGTLWATASVFVVFLLEPAK